MIIVYNDIMISIQLNNLDIASEVELYYRDSQYLQPSTLISPLYSSSGVIPKIHYLYEHFSHNSSIKNKRKRLNLVDIFYRIIKQNLNQLILELDGFNQDQITKVMMKVMNIPVIILNFDPQKNLVLQTYRFTLKSIQSLPRKTRIQVINRLVVLGQEGLLFEQQNTLIIQIIKNNFNIITKNYKILLYLIYTNQSLFAQVMQSLRAQDRILMLERLLFSNNVKPSTASLMQRIDISPNDQQFTTTLITSWCQPSFLNQTPYTQKTVTNLICLKLMSAPKQYLQQVMVLINQGIVSRFQYNKSFTYVRQSGLIVWKVYVKGLQLEDSVQGDVQNLCEKDLFEDDQQSKNQVNTVVVFNSHEIKKIQIPAPSEQKQKIEEQTQSYISFQPKNLYDCYLGLISDNPTRKRICLSFINQFVRTHKDDLIFTWQKILNSLLFLHDEGNHIADFQRLRLSALTSLIIYQPIQVVKSLSDRFFQKECCLSDKIAILNSLNSAIIQLSNNPNKYELEQNQEQFYFKKVTSKYYKQQDNFKKQKEVERSLKIDTQSRRWGHTKKQHQRKLKLSSQQSSFSSLVAIKRDDLLLHDPFVNRLYQVVQEVFFTFMYKIQTLRKLFSDAIFMDCLFGTLNTFVGNIENYHNKYRIIEQVLDIISEVKQKNPQIQKSRLGVLLKITSVLDKNISFHELLISNIDCLLKQLKEFQKMNYDPSTKIMLDIVQQRLYCLFQHSYSTPIKQNIFMV